MPIVPSSPEKILREPSAAATRLFIWSGHAGTPVQRREHRLDELKWMISRQIPHLRRYALALTRNGDRADDLVQDCLERALLKRHLWHRRGSLRSWLFRMLFRTYVDDRRRRRDETPATPEVLDGAVSMPAGQESRLEFRSIVDALARLPEEQRVVVLLVGLEGLAYDEVAEIVGVPIGTVRSRLSRGRHALRELRASGVGRRRLERVK